MFVFVKGKRRPHGTPKGAWASPLPWHRAQVRGSDLTVDNAVAARALVVAVAVAWEVAEGGGGGVGGGSAQRQFKTSC